MGEVARKRGSGCSESVRIEREESSVGVNFLPQA